MAKKVESENWGESVPQTCDWRKATNIISSIKNQVSVPTQFGPIYHKEWGDEAKALTPYPVPPSHPIHSGKLQVLLGHSSRRQYPGSVAHQIPPVCGRLCAGYDREWTCDRESGLGDLLTYAVPFCPRATGL